MSRYPKLGVSDAKTSFVPVFRKKKYMQGFVAMTEEFLLFMELW